MNTLIKVGIGAGNNPKAFESGRAIAMQAMRESNMEQPDLVLAFCSGRLDHGEFLQGLRSVVGPRVPIIGGSAIGIITSEFLGYEGYPAGAALIQGAELGLKVASDQGLDRDEYQVGLKLGEQLADALPGNLLLLFYDSIRTPPTSTTPPIMNASPPLLRGLEEKLGRNLPVVGAGVLGSFDFQATSQFCGFATGRQCAVGALLGGGLQPFFQIMHGCVPKDGVYHTITRMQGPCIFEVDGQPVVRMMDEIYGNQSWREQHPVKRLAIGVNHGQKYGDYCEDAYVNRLIAGMLPQGDGIVLFEPDLQAGAEFQFMLRDGRTMIESARRNALRLQERVRQSGKKPRLGLYIDCAGRTASYSDTLTEEAAEVQTVFAQWQVPLLGFYSGVEVAPMLGQSRGLDWTGVLLILTES